MPGRGVAARWSRKGRLAVAALALGACSQTASPGGTAWGTRLGASQLEPTRQLAAGSPRASSRAPVLELLDRHESLVFKRAAAEIVDYHAASQRVFVADAGAARVSVLGLGAQGFRGGERVLTPGRDVTPEREGSEQGQVTSLAVSAELLAIALAAADNDRPGRVALYAADELRYLGSVEVGFVPDMLTFTADGRRLLVANEGEQVRGADERIVADPEGSVSIIFLEDGVERARVAHARFGGFDARVEEYRAAGVRIGRLGDRHFESGEGKVLLSRDLEPEYIAVAPDGRHAWVSLQENDAVALLDIEAAAVVELFPLGLKDFALGRPSLERVALPAPGAPCGPDGGRGADARPAPGRAVARAESARGLWFEPSESREGRAVAYVLRGAALERHVLEAGRVSCTWRQELAPPGPGQAARWQGLARDARDGTFWVGDAARPTLYRFDAHGRRLGAIALPGAPHARVTALAFDATERHVLAFLDTPARRGDGGAARWARIVAVEADPGRASFGERLAEHLYLLGGAPGEPGARAVAASVTEPGRLVVLERADDGGSDAVFRVELVGASDVAALERGREPLQPEAAGELLASHALSPAHKRAWCVLSNPGAGDVAGLGVPSADRLLLLGAPGLALLPGAGAGPEPGAGAVLGVVRFDGGQGLDASDRDGAARLQPWPVLGAYMPDGIAALRLGGAEYFLTANEGDTRGYDARRLRDLTLDPARFPDAAALQSSASLGRLKVSTLDGDLDGDGDLDELHAFGARSVSLWDRRGRLVFDTGSLFEDVTAAALAGAFNSNNDDNGSFDRRSDDRGPEPEGLAVAEIDGRTYAFVGLERVGGVVVLDVTEPSDVRFVEYDNTRDFAARAERRAARDLGPEGLKFVPAAVSPTGRGLLLVANEVSGTTSAYHVNL